MGLGRLAPLARALLTTLICGVATGPGPRLAKNSASGTTIMPATTVRTKVTAPHSPRSEAQFTSGEFYLHPGLGRSDGT